jgi:hypothetical protein
MFECDYNGCNKSYKNKSGLTRHMKSHNESEKLKCSITGCSYATSMISDLKRHKAYIHNINVIWFECDQINCDYRCKSNSGLKTHKANIHNINVIWFECDKDNCNFKCKTNGVLKRHKANIHNIDVIWYKCDKDDCDFKCKNNNILKKHKANIHDINIKWFKCDQNNCAFKSKNKGDLKRHKVNIHDINIIWFECDQDNCDYRCKSNIGLKSHKIYIHDIDVIWYKCDQDNCNFECKSKTELNRHLSYFHDIGKHKCEICLNNRNSSIQFIDNFKNKLKICRECYNKSTGKDSKKETQMSDYLDKLNEITPFLVGSDKSFKSIGGCSLKRPDKLYISPEVALWIECDESQHLNKNSSYLCDEKRISDCYDEFNSKKLIVIRWNPDSYIVTKGKKLTMKERLIKLKELILEVLKTPPDELIYIYYMFYNKDNELISKNIPNKLVY